MPPRFMERMQRQNETMQALFKDQEYRGPPPYVSNRSSRSASLGSAPTTSSMQLSSMSPPPPLYQAVSQARPSLDETAIAKNSLILVTGANSWQGFHIVNQLLERGYRVRGTVRDPDKAVWTAKYFRDQFGPGRYLTAIIPDMAVRGAFNLAIRGCSGVIHTAHVTSMSGNPNDVVTPSIAGALNALEAAVLEPLVTRFVYTSSVNATISHERNEPNEVNSQSWNMMDFRDAWSPPPYGEDRAFPTYNASKMQTEAAVWKWHDTKKPNFVLNSVLPDTLWGRILDSHQTLPLSVAVLKATFDGNAPDYPACNFCDVEDSSILHIAALILPDIVSQRIFAVNGGWSIRSVTRLLRRLYPQHKIPRDGEPYGDDRTVFTEAPKAEELLRRMGQKGWTDMETSVERTISGIYGVTGKKQQQQQHTVR